jgi:hypothetical protein
MTLKLMPEGKTSNWSSAGVLRQVVIWLSSSCKFWIIPPDYWSKTNVPRISPESSISKTTLAHSLGGPQSRNLIASQFEGFS